MTDEDVPLGIKLLCLVFVLRGVIFLVFMGVAAGGMLSAIPDLDVTPWQVMGFGIYGVLATVGAYGLWNRRPWGWTLAFVGVGLDFVLSLLDSDTIGVVVALLILFYLYQKRELYRPRAASETGSHTPG